MFAFKLRHRWRPLAVILGGLVLMLSSSAEARPSVERLIDLAQKSYLQGRFDKSIELLRLARKKAHRPDALSRIHLFLGLNHAVQEAVPKAVLAFTRALNYDAALILDSESYSPSTLRLFAQAKADLKPKKTSPPRKPAAISPRIPTTLPISGHVAGPVPEPVPTLRASAVPPGETVAPFVVSVLAGGTIGLAEDAYTTFKATQIIGYHFDGGKKGPALGLAFSQAVGKVDQVWNYEYDGFVDQYAGTGLSLVLSAGFRFWWDLRFDLRLPLTVAPFVGLGYSYVRQGADHNWVETDFVRTAHAFDASLGVVISLQLADQVSVSLQAAPNIVLGQPVVDTSDGFMVRLDLMAGLQFSF
jgi:hypothetical protein